MNAKLARFLTKKNSKRFKKEIKEMNKKIKKTIKVGDNRITNIYDFSEFARKYYTDKGFVITAENFSSKPQEYSCYKYTLSW